MSKKCGQFRGIIQQIDTGAYLIVDGDDLETTLIVNEQDPGKTIPYREGAGEPYPTGYIPEPQDIQPM